MTTEKMSVHKALCELKTIDARIEKTIRATTYVFANKHNNTKVNGMSLSDFCAEIKANHKSAQDLIARRDAIKRAVTLSNATTKVMISGKEFTVAEAIDFKNHTVPLMNDMLSKMASDNMRARSAADVANGPALETRADEYIKSLYGNVGMKGASEEVKKVRADFITAQTTELVDPIKVVDAMAALEKEINDFTVEIDSALSVSNALTELEISY